MTTTVHDATKAIWTRYAKTCGARFQVQRKADEALHFSEDGHGLYFAIPTKLEGTSRFQDDVSLAGMRLDRYSRKRSSEVTEEGRIAIGFGMCRLGYIRRKHACWVRPLVENGYVSFYLLQITGGTEPNDRSAFKPLHGVNVCIYNLAEAIQKYAAHMEADVFARLIAA